MTEAAFHSSTDLVVHALFLLAGRALVAERAVAAEGEARRGEVERADDGARGGGEVASVGLAELLPGQGAERLVEDPVVPTLRVHLSPLSQPRHRSVRHVRRRPDCPPSKQQITHRKPSRISQCMAIANRCMTIDESIREKGSKHGARTVVPDVAGGVGGLAGPVLEQLAVAAQRLPDGCIASNPSEQTRKPADGSLLT